MRERFKKFTFLVAKLNKYVQKIKNEEMGEFNLKGPQVTCMYYLFSKGDLTSKEIRALSGEDKASISRSLDFLEENGYVVCENDGAKRYNSKYALTEKGKEEGFKITEKISKIINSVSGGVSEEDRAIMYNALELICFNLEQFCHQLDE